MLVVMFFVIQKPQQEFTPLSQFELKFLRKQKQEEEGAKLKISGANIFAAVPLPASIYVVDNEYCLHSNPWPSINDIVIIIYYYDDMMMLLLMLLIE